MSASVQSHHRGRETSSPSRSFGIRWGALFQLSAIVGLWVLGLVTLSWTIYVYAHHPENFGDDAHAYWLAAQGPVEYSRAAGTMDAYLYSPAFLTLISPISWMPWPAFYSAWTALLCAVGLWLVKPSGWVVGTPLFLFSVTEILVGNIYLLLAAAAVNGLRRPVTWALPVLTKITAGVGLVWFLARGEWRKLAIGSGGTALIAGVSYALDPAGWQAWVGFLLANGDGTADGLSSFVSRSALAVAIVALGARANWPWTIPLGMYLSNPVMGLIVPLTVFLAVPRLLPQRGVISARQRPSSSSQDHAPAPAHDLQGMDEPRR